MMVQLKQRWSRRPRRTGAATHRTARGRRVGFTLVELMVATFVGSSVAVVTVALASRQRSFHEAHRQVSEVQHNTGYLVDAVARDVRMAGYGLNVPSADLDQWITWVSGFTTNPKITQGASGLPDRLAVAAAFDAPLAEVVTGITTGATVVTVNYIGRGTAPFNATDNRVLLLGKTETVRITGVVASAGNLITLGISTDPNVIQGILYEYPTGTPLELVSVVEYTWNNGDSGTGYPYISRQDSAQSSTLGGLWEVSAENIEDFQVALAGDVFTVQATGRAAMRDKDFTHDTEGDNYRRRSYSARIRPRN